MLPENWTKTQHPRWCTVAEAIQFVSSVYWRVSIRAFHEWPHTVRYRARTRLLLVDEVVKHFDALEDGLAEDVPEYVLRDLGKLPEDNAA